MMLSDYQELLKFYRKPPIISKELLKSCTKTTYETVKEWLKLEILKQESKKKVEDDETLRRSIREYAAHWPKEIKERAQHAINSCPRSPAERFY